MKNKSSLFLVVLLLSFAGCGKKKKAEKRTNGDQVATNVDIPVADEGIRSFFDDEVGEFTLSDDKKQATTAPKPNDFAWEDEKNQKFKVIYFEFDKFAIKEDQKESVAFDISHIKNSLDAAQEKGVKPVVIIEGHACHSAGSAVYNLALSEKRAKVLADRFVAEGIAPESIKIVGRGQEVPALVDGKEVTGDREQQAPNRRDEIRVMFS